MTTDLLDAKPIKGHTHGMSAARRSAASNFFDRMITCSGYSTYMVQQSRTDQSRGIRGERSYFWGKDFTSNAQNDEMLDTSIPVMIDVDYHVDMVDYLSQVRRPVCLYTFQPGAAAAVREDYEYTFVGKELMYKVAGGGEYKHEIWNYQCDHVTAISWLWFLPLHGTVYSVARRTVDADHEVVLLIPIRTLIFPFSLFYYVIENYPLERLNPQAGDFTRIHVLGAGTSVMSTAVQGQFSSISIPSEVDDEIVNSAKLLKSMIGYPTVEQILRREKIDSKGGAKTLALFCKERVPGCATKCVVPPVLHFEHINSRSFENKKAMVSFMNPLLVPPCLPVSSQSNDVNMVMGRVVNVLSDAPVTQYLLDKAKQFAELLVPDSLAHTFVPDSMDRVEKKQCRPSQRAIIESQCLDEHTGFVSSFMKKEPYVKITNPRVISTIPGSTKIAYSMYQYTVSDLLKTTSWYAFGHTPLEIAEIIVDLCSHGEPIIGSDGNRWDGHYSPVLRMLERTVGLRMFNALYHDEFIKLHSLQYNQQASTTHGEVYSTEFSRESGSPETSNFNSMANKFISFLAFCDTGMSPAEAYAMPGIYGGDDGLTMRIEATALILAASKCGQKYESEVHLPGTSVKFLARVYPPPVWYGANDSVCMIERSMRSFNVTVSLNATTKVEKLIEKARGLFLTDRNTPLIGAFVTAVMRLTGESYFLEIPTGEVRSIMKWNSELPQDVQYPNWVDVNDVENLFVPDYVDRYAFEDYCHNAKSLDELMAIPSFVYAQSAHVDLSDIPKNVVINDELAGEIDPTIFVDKVEQAPKDSRNKDRLHHLAKVLPKDYKPRNLLDYGCGDGTITAAMAKAYPDTQVFGYDVHNRMLSADGWTRINEEGLKIPRQFDVITCFMTLHHIKEYWKTVANLASMLYDGGFLVIREHDVSDTSLVSKIDESCHPSKEPWFPIGRSALLSCVGKKLKKFATSNYPQGQNPLAIYTASFKKEPLGGNKSRDAKADTVVSDKNGWKTVVSRNDKRALKKQTTTGAENQKGAENPQSAENSGWASTVVPTTTVV